MTQKQALKHLAWAVRDSASWKGYYTGSLIEEKMKTKYKQARQALKVIRSHFPCFKNKERLRRSR